MTDNGRPLEQAKKSILAALGGSCECNTKTPNPAFHEGYCRYLKLLVALDCIDAAMGANQQIRTGND